MYCAYLQTSLKYGILFGGNSRNLKKITKKSSKVHS